MPSLMIEGLVRREHAQQMSVLTRAWIGVLFLQFGLIGLTIGAVPRFAVGESPISTGLAVTAVVIVALLFYVLGQWEHVALANIPVEIVDLSHDITHLGHGRVFVGHDYVFAQPVDALSRAIVVSTGPTLFQLTLTSIISIAALSLRQGGASLTFSLLVFAVSLCVQWRAYPSLHGIATKLEHIKGIRFSDPVPSDALDLDTSMTHR